VTGTRHQSPKGWKRIGEELLCAKCEAETYNLRAITIPVVGPADGATNEDAKQWWADFRVAIKPMWSEATVASNWIMRELYLRDTHRNSQDKLPKWSPPGNNFYHEVRAVAPSLTPTSVTSMIQSLSSQWRKVRYEVLWLNRMSLPSFRYPQPYPIHNQNWKLWFNDSGSPIFSAQIGAGEDKRIEMRLKGGYEFRRQLNQIKSIVTGMAIRGEAAIMEVGRYPDTQIVCKIAARLPRGAPVTNPEGTLYLFRAADALLAARNEKDERIPIFYADHIKRLLAQIAKHERHIKHWASDSKFEHRPHVPFAERRKAACDKHVDKMDSWCHEIAAEVAGYAMRRHFECVEYDPTDMGFVEHFPWFKLDGYIANKLQEKGIKLKVLDEKDNPVEVG